MGPIARRDVLLQLLRRRADWTVDRLAHELEVSGRTILRDLSFLRDRGFDIKSVAGPGGGVHLNPRSVMISSQLAADEVVALILSIAIARVARWIPFAGGAERALAKIESALPAQRIGELQQFTQRILIGDPLTDVPADASPIDPILVASFEEAFTSNHVFAFRYADRQGRRSRRCVEPHGLLVRPPLWYIVAWDVDRNAPRLFRADRIRHPTVTADTFRPRPHELVTGICPDARPST
jgi:predicted DNA-binding transcriptional regulator YafY